MAKSPALARDRSHNTPRDAGTDGLVMCDVVCYALRVTCVTRYNVVTRRVMYSPVLSQYNIMHHNERCEETRCYTISKLLPPRPFR